MSQILIQEIDLSKKSDLNRFVSLAWDIYKQDPSWIPPLKMAVKDVLNVKKHPFYATAEVKAFIAVKNGRDVGRILAINNKSFNEFHQKRIMHFGFFEAIDDFSVTEKLFDAVKKYAQDLALVEIEGPVNPGTNYECGLMVQSPLEGPQIMMTYNPSYYATHFEKLGLKKIKDLIAYKLNIVNKLPDIILKISERTQKKSRVTFRNINLKKWNEELEILFDIYNQAWEKNWGFVPMTKAEFFHTAKDLKSIVDPNLVLIAEVDQKPAGFVLTLPDLNQVFKQIPSGNLSPLAIYKILTAKKRMTRCRVITMGVKKEFRKIGIETILYTESQRAILDKTPYREVELSWILEDNLEMNAPIIRMGAEPYKHYRIYNSPLQTNESI